MRTLLFNSSIQSISETTKMGGDDKNIHDNISIGSKIGLSFNIGKFDHPIYGTGNLCGNIPLILPYGSYIEPTIINEPKKLETMITQLIPEYRDLWGNELDSTIGKILKDAVLGTSCLNPMDDISTDKMQVLLLTICIGFSGDDIVDNSNEYSNEYYEYKNLIKLFKNINELIWIEDEDGILKLNENISSPIPSLQHLKPFILKFKAKYENIIPNPYIHMNELKQNICNTVLCDGLIKTGHTKIHNTDFSYSTKQFFSGYQGGMSVYLEFITVIRGVKLSNEIRHDILFQRMKILFGIASHLMNDILGCGRDIHLNHVGDSSILYTVVHKGIPLQIAFDQALHEIFDAMNDIRIVIKILKECYLDDKHLLEYICCTERMLDGQLYGYQHVRRYGELNLKIVSIN